MYVTLGVIVAIQYSVGAYSLETATNVVDTMKKGGLAIHDMLVYVRDVSEKVFYGQVDDWKEPAYALVMSALLGCILYVLVGAPLKAGLWTGRKAKRHVAHRYMGLLFLVQYGAAWAHFLSDYEDASSSYITHFISLNGKIISFFFVVILAHIINFLMLDIIFNSSQGSPKESPRIFPLRSFPIWMMQVTTQIKLLCRGVSSTRMCSILCWLCLDLLTTTLCGMIG